MPTISKGRTPLTLINVFTVTPEKQDELISLLSGVTEQNVWHHQGFISASLHRGIDGRKVTMYPNGLAPMITRRCAGIPALLLRWSRR